MPSDAMHARRNPREVMLGPRSEPADLRTSGRDDEPRTPGVAHHEPPKRRVLRGLGAIAPDAPQPAEGGRAQKLAGVPAHGRGRRPLVVRAQRARRHLHHHVRRPLRAPQADAEEARSAA